MVVVFVEAAVAEYTAIQLVEDSGAFDGSVQLVEIDVAVALAVPVAQPVIVAFDAEEAGVDEAVVDIVAHSRYEWRLDVDLLAM